MVLGFVVSGVYNKFLATKTYTARQSLILRDDLLGDAYKPSRFESQESLKSAQETVLEIARKPQVVRAVLDQLGPARLSLFSGEYPSAETIEDVQGNITLSAPNGAEFGKTEAVVLSVKTVDAERSRKFVNMLLDEIDAKLSEVRQLRLSSMQNELAQAGENAMKSLNVSSQRLQELEKGFGAEITTIRGLNDPQGSGGFDLKINQIRLEQRQAAAKLSSAKNQRELLLQAQQNGGVEFVTSNELLELQPALQGIMTNLSTAMAQLAIDEGRYTTLHPQLQRSRRAVKQQKQQLFDSIGTTLKGLDSQIETLSGLNQRLGGSILQLETKLKHLTEQRVPYATLEEEVKKKAEVYNEVQGRLAQVQSYANSTNEVAMLTRVDQPQVSSRPDQIGTMKAGLIGGAMGLMFGLGLVALLGPNFVDPRTNYTHTSAEHDHSPKTFGGSPNSANATGNASGPAPQTTPVPAAVTTPQETHAESRLKSVTAMQRNAATRVQEPLGGKKPEVATAKGGLGVVREALDSVVPDSVAQHMAGIKQRVKEGLPLQRHDTAPPTPTEVAPAKSEVKRRPVTPPAAAGEAAVGSAAVQPSSDAVVAKSVDTNGTASQTASPERTTERSDVSSEDVIAALKKLQSESGEKVTSESAIPPGTASEKVAAEAEESRAQAEDDVVIQRRPSLSPFAKEIKASPKQVDPTMSNSTVPEQRAIENPEIVAVDRIRSPQVPESITKGRITAESLLSSAEKNKDVENNKAKGQTSVKEKLASLPNEPLKPAAAEDEVEPANRKGVDSRIPSITDYARSLDRKLGSTEGDRISVSEDDVTSSSATEPPTPSHRTSNVRPLDIARSLEDPSLQRVVQENVSANETNADSAPAQSRSQSLSDYVGAIDNSVAGLVRSARNSDVQQREPQPSAQSVAPSEKLAAKPVSSASAVPVPRDEQQSAASIPAQIRELSGSFSSFARPTVATDSK